MKVTLRRTLRPRQYESLTADFELTAEDYPEAENLTGDDLRDYLFYQGVRAVGYFEITHGAPAAEVRQHVSQVHEYLKIERLGAKLNPPQKAGDPARPTVTAPGNGLSQASPVQPDQPTPEMRQQAQAAHQRWEPNGQKPAAAVRKAA